MLRSRAEDRDGLWIEDRLGRGISILPVIVSLHYKVSEQAPAVLIRGETLDYKACRAHNLYSHCNFDAWVWPRLALTYSNAWILVVDCLLNLVSIHLWRWPLVQLQAELVQSAVSCRRLPTNKNSTK